jgi:DNA-binding transcriptional MerR regulator|tara:strand:- start:174 stop:485 length:312 start_codon:yes stop_codon:yes gene_type:complete
MKNPNALKTIGEVAKILSVPVHVIRFWEKKFSSVTPIKKNGGNRYYDQKQLRILEKVKTLLYIERYSIEGAKKVLKKEIKNELEKLQLVENIKDIIKKLKSLI